MIKYIYITHNLPPSQSILLFAAFFYLMSGISGIIHVFYLFTIRVLFLSNDWAYLRAADGDRLQIQDVYKRQGLGRAQWTWICKKQKFKSL